MRIDVVTLFPGMFDSVLGSSILARAASAVTIQGAAEGEDTREPVVSYHLHDPRNHTTDKHSKVDQPPYGGGPGMVLQCQPIFDCVSAVEAEQPSMKATRIVMTPKGVPLTQPLAEELAGKERLLVIAGHYEGFDQRVLDELEPMEVSIGDYVLTGGELPAMVLIDSVVRLLPGVLGKAGSHHHDSFSPGSANDAGQRLLDHPHYTRPPEWRGREVPEVLLSGDHAKIAAWREKTALELTKARRLDLLAQPHARPTSRGGIAASLRDAGALSSGQTPASRRDAAIAQGAGSTPWVVLRDALDNDFAEIDALLRIAFPTDAEADLVIALRGAGDLPIELVAEIDGQVVGHIGFSPVSIDPAGADGKPAFSNPRFRALALAPLAVHPAHQRQGLGRALTRLGLRYCDDANLAAVFVLGEPAVYAPLGFKPAGPLGYTNPFHEGDAFQVCFLTKVEPTIGAIQYAPAFATFEK